MPVLAYLAMDNARELTRADFVRLGLVTGAGAVEDDAPYSSRYLRDFEERYCYDQFWNEDRARQAGHAPHVVRPRVRHGRRRGRSVFRRSRRRLARPVPPPVFPAVPYPAHPQGDAADAVRPHGRCAQPSRHPRRRIGQALQADDPAVARDLPALHAPVLVPRGIGPAAGEGAVPDDVELSGHRTGCTTRSTRSSATWRTTSKATRCAARRTPSCG